MTPDLNKPASEDCAASESIACLENQLQELFRGRVVGLRLVPQGAGLILKGQTRTYYIKQLVQAAVMKATDRPLLANRIEVG